MKKVYGWAVQGDFKMKKAIYYLRDHDNAPRMTVCLMKDNDGVISKGLALCSLDDNPSKKDIRKTHFIQSKYLSNPLFKITEMVRGGRSIAETRAQEALLSKKSSGPICRKEANKVLESVGEYNYFWYYKSEYNAQPINGFEQKLIRQMN